MFQSSFVYSLVYTWPLSSMVDICLFGAILSTKTFIRPKNHYFSMSSFFFYRLSLFLAKISKAGEKTFGKIDSDRS